MGSALCTQEWVANRLNTTTRTVRNYVKRGLLKQSMKDGHPAYDHDEVEQLALERGTDFPVMNRRAFIEMQRQLYKLEQDMSVVRRAMDIQNDPWRPSIPEAVQFYKLAVTSLGAGKWGLEEIEYWSEKFDRLDEVSLALFAEATLVDHPWDVFFRLCINMMLQVSTGPQFKNDLGLQELHKKLDQGRKKMRGTAIIWFELHPGSSVQELLNRLESPQEDLRKRLIGNSK